MLTRANHRKERAAGRSLVRGLVLALLAGPLVGLGGCTRGFYRKRSDKDVEDVLTEKNTCPDWAIKNWWVYPDPRARFADPTNPDRPPMPPDDPAAACSSPHPQKPGKAGIARIDGKGYLDLLAKWDAENRDPATGGPTAEQEAPKTVDRQLGRPSPLHFRPKAFLITMNQAAELAMINSREYQDRRENLYLTALPVSLERNAFAAQLFGAMEAIRDWSGRETPQGHQNRWVLNSAAGVGKLFSTGALLLFNFANQTVINMGGLAAGQRHVVSESTMTLDFIQPLLRGGGRAVTLEPLTQAERNLLYEIRTYARFRKEEYVAIAGGGGGSISGGAFVPTGVLSPTAVNHSAGLSGSGLTPGFIPGVPATGLNGLQLTPATSGNLNLNTAIAPTISGVLGTILQYVQIGFDKDNIAKLEEFMKLFEATKEGGDISQLQVDQLQQQLLSGYSNLYLDQQQYYNSLDQLKLQLGIPENLELELDDSSVRPLLKMFRNFEEVVQQFGDVGKVLDRRARNLPAEQLRAELHRLVPTLPLVKGVRFRTEFPERWADWEKLSPAELNRRLSDLKAERKKLQAHKDEVENAGKSLTKEEQERSHRVDFETDLGNFELILRAYEARPWMKAKGVPQRELQRITMFRAVVGGLVQLMVEARNERLELLSRSWPEVAPVCVNGVDLLKVDLDEAYAVVDRTALANRLDLMNVRAQTVDAWRQIRVFANALLGVFNVEYRLTGNSPLMAAQPLNVGGSHLDHQLILSGDLPLVRWVEQNNYRASLIAFQRQRRALQEAEDLAMQAVRGEIRQLRQYAEQYKLNQKQVELAYLTVENSLDVFQQPTQPGQLPSPPTQPQPPGTALPTAPTTSVDTATRAATLTNQLLMAQSRVPLAQNQVCTYWINYLVTRLQLYRDLELMPLDNRGVWIDESSTSCDKSSGACGSNPGPAAAAGPKPGPGADGLPDPRAILLTAEPVGEQPH